MTMVLKRFVIVERIDHGRVCESGLGARDFGLIADKGGLPRAARLFDVLYNDAPQPRASPGESASQRIQKTQFGFLDDLSRQILVSQSDSEVDQRFCGTQRMSDLEPPLHLLLDATGEHVA
jgi:hypothetical protein